MPIKSLMISKSGKWFVKPFLNELELAPDQQKMGNEKLVSYNRNYFLQLVLVGFYIPIICSNWPFNCSNLLDLTPLVNQTFKVNCRWENHLLFLNIFCHLKVLSI